MQPPPLWWISQACEAFHCTPSQARAEAADDVLEILELREYANAKALLAQEDVDESLVSEFGKHWVTLITRDEAERKKAARAARKG